MFNLHDKFIKWEDMWVEGSSNTHGATLPKTETTLLLFVDVGGSSQSPKRKEAKSKRYESKLSTEKNLSNAKILKWGKKKKSNQWGLYHD